MSPLCPSATVHSLHDIEQLINSAALNFAQFFTHRLCERHELEILLLQLHLFPRLPEHVPALASEHEYDSPVGEGTTSRNNQSGTPDAAVNDSLHQRSTHIVPRSWRVTKQSTAAHSGTLLPDQELEVHATAAMRPQDRTATDKPSQETHTGREEPSCAPGVAACNSIPGRPVAARGLDFFMLLLIFCLIVPQMSRRLRLFLSTPVALIDAAPRSQPAPA